MAKRIIDEATLTSLADAVRAMTGITDPLTLDDMIRHIQETGGSVTTNTAEGNPIQIADCMTRKLHGLTIYGKTIQNGTPSPSAPVALNSAGADGNIIVNVDTQTLNVSTPYGLPGIPVPSDGNYTDASGQQWVCDEVDFARGKYVQRVTSAVFNGSEAWYSNSANNNRTRIALLVTSEGWYSSMSTSEQSTLLCTAFPATSPDNTYHNIEGICLRNNQLYIYASEYQDVDSWKQYLADNPMTVFGTLNIPIETDLSVEELVAYAKLHTNYPQTVIYNDADTWMSVKYVVDVATEADYQDALREMGVDV